MYLNESHIRNVVRQTINKFLLREENEQNDFASACSYIYCQDDNGEWCILAARRGSSSPSEKNKYNPPMGMKEDYEDVVDCAVRECEEETGLSLPKDEFDYINSEMWGKGKMGANFLVILDGTTSDYKPGRGDGENERFSWIPMSEIGNLDWAYQTGYVAMEFFKKYVY